MRVVHARELGNYAGELTGLAWKGRAIVRGAHERQQLGVWAVDEERKRKTLLRVEALQTNAVGNLNRHWKPTACDAASNSRSGGTALLARCKTVSSDRREVGDGVQEPFLGQERSGCGEPWPGAP
jgi:hypothetical protein